MVVLKKLLVLMITMSWLLTACGGQKQNEVKITLTEYGIQSSVTEFQVGVPYHFVVTNKGQINHEYMIMPPLSEEHMGMAMDMAEMDKMALAMIEADELTPGKTQTFDYTFAEAAPSGSLEFACHTPGHYEQGMKLPIIVK